MSVSVYPIAEDICSKTESESLQPQDTFAELLEGPQQDASWLISVDELARATFS